jgi:hypothetical protein
LMEFLKYWKGNGALNDICTVHIGKITNVADGTQIIVNVKYGMNNNTTFIHFSVICSLFEYTSSA